MGVDDSPPPAAFAAASARAPQAPAQIHVHLPTCTPPPYLHATSLHARHLPTCTPPAAAPPSLLGGNGSLHALEVKCTHSAATGSAAGAATGAAGLTESRNSANHSSDGPRLP